jgi:DNA mismatch endonuclease (patch repair protein)
VDHPLPGLRRRADIVFPRDRTAIFVDGCFWHACPEHGTWPKQNAEWWREKILSNVARDRDTDANLEAINWTVVRVWEHDSSEEAARRIAALLTDVRANVQTDLIPRRGRSRLVPGGP